MITTKLLTLAALFFGIAHTRTVQDLPPQPMPQLPGETAVQEEPMDEYTRKKIAEYNRFSPTEAEEDARRDIAEATIRLFYLDVEELPELLVIDKEAATLPKGTSVFIGSGCTDDIHSEDGPTLYRYAMEKALNYGTRYNRVVAEHFKLPQKSSPDLLPSESLEFFGLPDNWPQVKMELYDIQVIHGGRAVWVSGSGRALVRVVRWANERMEEQIFRFSLDNQDIERIISEALEQDFITLEVPSQSGPPDHGTPKIIFTSPTGQFFSESAWSPPLPGGDPAANRRFQAVYRQFLRFEALALENQQPVYTGNFDSQDDTTWQRFIRE